MDSSMYLNTGQFFGFLFFMIQCLTLLGVAILFVWVALNLFEKAMFTLMCAYSSHMRKRKLRK